jgi:SAM-dependent methyltransferase
VAEDDAIVPSAACISLNPHVAPLHEMRTADLRTASANAQTSINADAVIDAASINDPASIHTAAAIPPVYPSRLPRDQPPLGVDGRPATRWTDPQIAAAYAERDDSAERDVAWPVFAALTRPAAPRRASGRPDGLVLEIGSGLGALARHLAEWNWLRVYAFDVSPAMHRLGAARFRDAWIVRTLPDSRGRIPLRSGQCTAAIAQRMLLHLAHPCLMTGLLTDTRRVLRPGAEFAILERDTRFLPPNHAGNDQPEDGAPYVERYRLLDGATLPTTAWRYSPATIVRCLTDSGFAVEGVIPLRAAEPLLLYRAKAV